jgi:hypothetical protein
MQSKNSFPSRAEAFLRANESKKQEEENALRNDWLEKHSVAVLAFIAKEFINPFGKFGLSYAYDDFAANLDIPVSYNLHRYMEELFDQIAAKLKKRRL